MNILEVQQGSQAWLELRRSHDTASEAPAMMGVSKYQTRGELLKQKSTGLVDDIDPAKQKLFDRGHASEAMARPLAEAIIGADLYPVTANMFIGELRLLASLDGATMDEVTIWEHKLWSESLAADVRNGTLGPHYTVQMDQQLMVAGASRCLFMTSDGTSENMAWCWYETTPEKCKALTAGWNQFHEDLAAYSPPEIIVPAVATPQMGLPAVSITVNGSIALVDNLDKFGAALTAYIDKLNRKPETDQDFANLEDAVKRLKSAEEQLDAAEANALAQTDSIDTMRRTVALHRDTARSTRLLIDKLVKAEKENRRTAIISDAAAELVTHLRKLNERLGKPLMPVIQADFQGVVKGLKSLDSMKDKVTGELARCKIEANATADRIQANLAVLQKRQELAFLFADVALLVLKQPDDFQNTVTARITAHEAAEAAKEEAIRERIRAEEQVKADKEARDRLAAEQEAVAKAERERIAAEAAKVERIVTAPDIAPVTNADVVKVIPPAVRQAMAPKPAVVVSEPTLKLGEIGTRLGFTLTADFLATLGFEPAKVDRASKLFHESDFPAICNALLAHISEVSEQFDAVSA